MKKVIIAIIAMLTLCSCGEPTQTNTNVSEKISNIETHSKDVTKSEKKPLELIESGYGVSGSGESYYIYYGLILNNPNTDFGVEFPSVRITAYSSEGAVLGTQDIVLNDIYPQQTISAGFQAFSVSQRPDKVDFQVLEPKDYNWTKPDNMEYQNFQPLTVENISATEDSLRSKKFTGEIVNSNPYDIKSVAVTILFRDEAGIIVGGNTTFCDNLTANGKLPFQITAPKDILTENYEIYAKTW